MTFSECHFEIKIQFVKICENEVTNMKKYTIELNDDLSAIYEDIAKFNQKSTEEALQNVLKRAIETILRESLQKL